MDQAGCAEGLFSLPEQLPRLVALPVLPLWHSATLPPDFLTSQGLWSLGSSSSKSQGSQAQLQWGGVGSTAAPALPLLGSELETAGLS